MAALSEEEVLTLKKFRKVIQAEDIRLNDRQQHDMALISWLRARELDISKATEMLKKSCEWRKTNDIDNILNWKPPESYTKLFPYEICGKTTDDCPILIVPFGKYDVRNCVEAGEKDVWLHYIDQGFAILYEEIYKINISRGTNTEVTPISQFLLIVDLKGYSLRQITSFLTVQTVLECAKRFEDNYPEILKRIYYINAPRIFSIIFSIAKPTLSDRKFGKIEICTSNANKWKPAILKYIQPDQLPIVLGGTNPNSCKFLSKEYVYGAESQLKLNENHKAVTEFITTTISAGQDFKLEFDITKENTTIEWTFKTDLYNIGSSILYNFKDEILIYKKYDSHIDKQNGFIICQKLGTYTIIFDNKFSKLRGKTVHYTVSIDEPEE